MRNNTRRRRGIILLLVLVVVAMLSLAALGFAELMLDEHRAAITASRQSQARSFAESGAEVASQFLDRELSDMNQAGGIYDNSSRFADQLVNAEEQAPQDRGRFSVVAPKTDGVTVSGVRYGLQDESTRINLSTLLNYDQASGSAGANEPAQGNTFAHIMLMGLPGMTDDVADNILYWIDPAAKARPNGVDATYYSAAKPSLSTAKRPAHVNRRAAAGQRRDPRTALRHGRFQDGTYQRIARARRERRRRGQFRRLHGPRLGRLFDPLERRDHAQGRRHAQD